MPKRNEFLERADRGPADVTEAFDSWNSGLEAAGTSIEDALLAELERVVEAVEGYPTSGDMGRQGAYNSGKYSTYFGSWAAAVDAADIDSDDSTGYSKSTAEEPRANGPAEDETASHEDVLDDYFTLAELPNESRFHGETAVYVAECHAPDEKKDGRFIVQDVTGTSATFDIWAKHDYEFDWTVGEWYVLSEVRFQKWDKNGETTFNLSSSRDLTVTQLAADVPGVTKSATGTSDDELVEESEDEAEAEEAGEDALESNDEAEIDESNDKPWRGTTCSTRSSPSSITNCCEVVPNFPRS